MAQLIPILKANEKTSGGRLYTHEAITIALDKIKWDTNIPVSVQDRSGSWKDQFYLKKQDFKYEDKLGILSVNLREDACERLVGRTLAPYLYVNRVRKGKKDIAIIDDFTLNAIQATQDLCSFPSINASVK